MIGTFSTEGFTREAWIEKRVAEGFTKEQAEHEFDNYTDPAIAKAQEQKVPTRGEMIQMINEAILNNPNKKQLYIPDFSLSAEYIGLKNELDKAVEANNLELVQELNKRMFYVKMSGTVTNEEIQAEIDKTLVMPLSEVFEKEDLDNERLAVLKNNPRLLVEVDSIIIIKNDLHKQIAEMVVKAVKSGELNINDIRDPYVFAYVSTLIMK